MDAKTTALPATLQNPPPDLYEGDELDLREMLDVILEAKWLVLGVAAAVFLGGIFYAWAATPIYKANALIQIEKRQSVLPGLDELSNSLMGSATESNAEIEIIRSRSVIGRVVQDLGLDVVAAPRRFPVIGNPIARRHTPGEPAGAWPGFRQYAWGGERIALGRLAVPAALESAPLRLTTGRNGTFQLHDQTGVLLLQAKAGESAKADTPAGPVEVFVRELVANPGTQFTLVKRNVDQVISDLQGGITVSEKGRLSGILIVSLEGDKRQRVANIVNGIVNSYIRQNVERRSEEASRMLEFLDQQMPELKKQLDAAETTLREYKSTRGAALDISATGQELLTRTTDLERQISELELQRSELRQRFTEQHPTVVTLNQKLAQLRQSRGTLEQEFRGLPETELQSIRLLRNVSVANELYVQLLNKAQELKVAKAGTVGNARVVDNAFVPPGPVRPRKSRVLALSLMLGVFLGVAVVYVRRALRRTLDNPDHIEKKLGLPVYATIPHSSKQGVLGRLLEREPAGAGIQMLCRTAPQDAAVESLRSLRTSLQFAMLEARSNIITIHGPTPEIGKSFVAGNLAFLLADAGKRVLLIDADMRKGHLHTVMGVQRVPGLSDLIVGPGKLVEAIHQFEEGKVAFLASGTLPPNPSELLVQGSFATLLREFSQKYDFVVIDTPPTLNLADSIAVGKLSGVNFLVVRSGFNTLVDVQIPSRRLQQNGIKVDGVIFNDLSMATSRYRYGGYYAYQYKPHG